MIYRYIYKITCTSGQFKDKFYFGQRTTNKDPYKDSYKGSGSKIQRYYKKYPNDYIKEIICFCNSQEELDKAEYDIIEPWLGNTKCLNLRSGGDKYILTDEVKKKISDSKKGRPSWNKGINWSEEAKKKVSDDLKGRCLSDEHKKHISEGTQRRYKLHHVSEDTRKKISDINKGRPKSEETKRKLSDALKGRPKSEETKKLMVGRHRSEETKLKISKALRGRHRSEETKLKISKAYAAKRAINS